MTVVNLDIQQQLLVGSETVNNIVGELDYGGGGSGPARSRGIGDSDDEDDF